MGVLNYDWWAVINYVSMHANYRVLTILLILIIINFRSLLLFLSHYYCPRSSNAVCPRANGAEGRWARVWAPAKVWLASVGWRAEAVEADKFQTINECNPSFGAGEPDNYGSEDCVVADISDGFNWKDIHCTELHPWVVRMRLKCRFQQVKHNIYPY